MRRIDAGRQFPSLKKRGQGRFSTIGPDNYESIDILAGW
jgi:hypothetical protein